MPFFMLHPREIEQTKKMRKAQIIDLREREKYQKSHYVKACNMPYRENECWLESFSRNNVYILYCDYGNISLLAARKLSKRGITAYTVVGGMDGIRRVLDGKDVYDSTF